MKSSIMNNSGKTISAVAVVLLIFFLNFNHLSSHQSAAELFEKALYLEEAQGELHKAIDLYEKILEQYPDDRETAAKAQLHIGLCYEKLGLQEAPKAFRKVVDDFPEQKEAVRVAKEKLSIFQSAQRFIKTGDKEFKIRKVWTGPEVAGLGSISPDGLYLTFVDWDTGDLGILELTTGKKRRLTKKGSWLESKAMAFQSRWSPDGKQIVFDWWDWAEPVFVGLRAVEPDGSNLRDLYKLGKPYDRVTMVYKWLSNGKDILLLIGGQEKGLRIVLLSKKNRIERTLKTLDGSRVLHNEMINMDCSPDDNHIVYDFPSEDSSNRDIYTVSIDGEEETPLIEHPADDVLLGWAPDGKNILFSSDRRGSVDLWSAPVKNGELGEIPNLIISGIGEIQPQGFTEDGSFYYISTKGAQNVYTAQLDPETGRVLEQPKNPIMHIGKSTHSPSYSSDGKYLAYIADRGSIGDTRFVLVIRDLDTGDEREIYPGYDFRSLRWSPDNQSILALAVDKPDRTGRSFLCLIDVTYDKIISVVKCELDRYTQWISSADWTHDGKSVFYVFTDKPKKLSKLLVHNLRSKEEKELYRAPSFADRFDIARSHDGQWLALIYSAGPGQNRRVLQIIPATGGERRELFSFEDNANWWTQITWSADGKHILFVKSSSKGIPRVGGKSDLWRIPVEGGKPQKLGLTMSRFFDMTAHPDGTHIAFTSYGSSMKTPELWVMENFLPQKK